MNLITINNLTKTYDATVILDKISFQLNTSEKIAIVGRNGAGKSTLAKIICNLEPFDQGDIFISSNINIGYFSQESFIDTNDTVYEEMRKVFKKQILLQQELDQIAMNLNDNYNEATLNKYNHLLQSFEDIGGYDYEYKIDVMLNKFGFKDYYQHNVHNLSGGQRTRLALAKLLLEAPDILVLDEPTNHLDLETVEFLENFLRSYKNSVIIISHDRFFLNQVTNLVYEIEFNKGIVYKGNYDSFLKQKEENYQQMLKQYDLQQKMIKKEQEFIDKNIVRATTSTRAKSRRKRLEKIDVLDNPRMDNKNININFNFNRNTGNIVLEINDLTIGYNEPLMKHIDFLIKKNDKVAIIGPNGIGKSTLLKTINQKLNPIDGDIKYGAGVNIAYFDQDLAMLNSTKTVIDELWDENRMMLEKDVRKVLGSFLFTQEDVFKNVCDLSGGEKVRLALSKLVLQKANFLILDEVTNHLDILSREVLEKALIEFEGTIVFVSHDRFFINRVATRIIELSHDMATDYMGNYSYYLEKKQEKKDKEEKTKVKKNTDYLNQKEQQKDLKLRQKRANNLEEEINILENKINELKELQLQEDVYSDYEKAHEIKNLIDEKHNLLDELIHEWTALIETLE